MAHQVPWTKNCLEIFIHEGLLTEDEEKIIRSRVAGWSRTKQALTFNMSVSTVDKIISKLKKKYDEVQKHNPNLPKRKTSKEEEWMDNN